MIDFDALLLKPCYAAFGVAASLFTEAGDRHDITIIDMSDGVEVALGDISVPTLKPAAAVRRAELAEKNVLVEDIDDGQLSFNDRRWRVSAHIPKPSPNGEDGGELFLILSDERIDT